MSEKSDQLLEKLQKWNKVFKKKMQDTKRPKKVKRKTKWRSIDEK